jgi:ketosteroid isomerase-like protein
MMTRPVDTVRRFYDALGGGDVAAILSLFDAQIEWTEAERFPYYGGTWHGPQAVLDNVLVPLSGDWEGFSAQAHEFIAEVDRVVCLGTYSGTFKKTGRSFSAAFAHVWSVRGDKLVRFDMHTDTAKVLEAMQG